MWPDNRLQELLGIEHPIIQAPMANASTPQMAAAAANNGCVGSLGCAMMSPETYLQTFNETHALTNGALNMNFFCHEAPKANDQKDGFAHSQLEKYYSELGIDKMPDAVETHFPFNDDMMDAVLRTSPRVVSFHFGLPKQEIIAKLKETGAIILSSATTVTEARDLEQRGCDAIIAQGWEAGGHHGYYLEQHSAAISTMALVPQVVDAVDVPVIATGGIADGRGIAAALSLGAAGVQIGTAFLTASESGVSNIHKKSLLQSDGSNTMSTTAFSGRPARGIANRYMKEMEAIQDRLPDFPLMNTLTGPLRKVSAGADSPDFAVMWSGQAVGLNQDTDVASLITRLVTEAQSVFKKLGGTA